MPRLLNDEALHHYSDKTPVNKMPRYIDEVVVGSDSDIIHFFSAKVSINFRLSIENMKR